MLVGLIYHLCGIIPISKQTCYHFLQFKNPAVSSLHDSKTCPIWTMSSLFKQEWGSHRDGWCWVSSAQSHGKPCPAKALLELMSTMAIMALSCCKEFCWNLISLAPFTGNSSKVYYLSPSPAFPSSGPGVQQADDGPMSWLSVKESWGPLFSPMFVPTSKHLESIWNPRVPLKLQNSTVPARLLITGSLPYIYPFYKRFSLGLICEVWHSVQAGSVRND